MITRYVKYLGLFIKHLHGDVKMYFIIRIFFRSKIKTKNCEHASHSIIINRVDQKGGDIIRVKYFFSNKDNVFIADLKTFMEINIF